jgi:DNA mismatch repair protein MutS2
VKPDASPELIRLHRQATSLEEAMRQRLGTIMRQAAERDLLQEALIVSRDGRFCVPVKATVQSRFQGIVHDRSASGATVFMEPLEIVERGNRLRETYLAIRDEQEAVLRALTHHVGDISESVQSDQQTLGLLDFISARARLALEMDAAPPELADDGVTSLRSARHPFIADQHVVPTSIWIGDEFSTLVITGPNTGGKTVCLKTLGLLTLMAMSGLHIPAEAGSRVSVFENVWADIGDEQSIEQSLSTFSSHMTQIVKVINRIYARRQRSEESNSRPLSALVLLDEVGAGTDPTEGAALARTILSFLHQSGCRTVATTHYNSLKLFAYAQEGMQNASVQFDPRTLQPTYRLLIGSPGSSNAFEIAQRLGLPRRLVSDARASLDDEQLTAEQAISQMRSSQQRYDRQTHNLKQESRQMSNCGRSTRRNWQLWRAVKLKRCVTASARHVRSSSRPRSRHDRSSPACRLKAANPGPPSSYATRSALFAVR